jgi:hypothetical protein
MAGQISRMFKYKNGVKVADILPYRVCEPDDNEYGRSSFTLNDTQVQMIPYSQCPPLSNGINRHVVPRGMISDWMLT